MILKKCDADDVTVDFNSKDEWFDLSSSREAFDIRNDKLGILLFSKREMHFIFYDFTSYIH